MKRNTHFIVPAAKFQLLQGEDKLSLYQVRGLGDGPVPGRENASWDSQLPAAAAAILSPYFWPMLKLCDTHAVWHKNRSTSVLQARNL